MQKLKKKKQKKETPHLDFYHNYVREGLLPIKYDDIRVSGLCNAAVWLELDDETLQLFEPTRADKKWLEWEGHDVCFWGSGSSGMEIGIFTELRQNIILFMAAINGEL